MRIVETQFGNLKMVGVEASQEVIDLTDADSRASLMKIGINAQERRHFADANRVWAYLFAWSERKREATEASLRYLWKASGKSARREDYDHAIAILHDDHSGLELSIPPWKLSHQALSGFCLQCRLIQRGKIATGEPDAIGPSLSRLLDPLNVVVPYWVLAREI